MNLSEKKEKIKLVLDDLFIVLVVFAVALISFGLGRISVVSENKEPLSIEKVQTGNVLLASDAEIDRKSESETPALSDGGLLVVSKNGTKYHFPWCSGAQRIKEENKVWFESREDAEKAGYGPAGNCKGL